MEGIGRWAVVLLLAALALIAGAGAAPPDCIKLEQPCVRNSECCEACCHDGKCVGYADGCQRGPCALHACPSGKVCYLQQVQCVAARCDPIPACRDQHSDYDYE